ncbi:MAG: flagellar hook-basal body complex protein FliE [Acidobacteria bacterium]|nr:flagellar hook-basal body complex protein FliE [Acidobacteriota bacterium]
MVKGIAEIAPAAVIDLVELSGKSKPAEGGFGSIFEQAMARVERYQKDSQQQIDRFLRGEDQEVHELVLAAQRAELSLELFLQVRNKVVQAYQEVMRMQM